MGALKQHKLALHRWPCASCNREFNVEERLADHQKSTGHCYCKDCDRFFASSDALRQHRRSPIHVNQFHCCDCDRDFATESALEQHLTDKVHTITRRRTSSFICRQCNREFGDERALEQHLSSLAHRPLSSIKCIAAKCKGCFTNPSALLHHLESGSCRSGINRLKLNSLIQTHDTARIICDKGIADLTLVQVTKRLQNISDAGVSTPESESESEVIFTPSSSSSYSYPASPSPTAIRNPMAIAPRLPVLWITRCPICPPTRRPFPSPHSLLQHLESAAHADRIFHCPESIFLSIAEPSTKKYFSTLSGLAQHLESGVCHGGLSTLRTTARYVEEKLRELGWSGRLLSR